MTKEQFFAIDYEEFIDLVEAAADSIQHAGKDLHDVLGKLKTKIEMESFCARNAKDANEAGLVCAVNTDLAEEVAYDILSDLDERYRKEDGCGFNDDMVRREIDPIFVVADEERKEIAS